MLFSSIKNASHNDISSERFQRALAWLATTDMSTIECGRHDIVGDEVFANVMEFTTVPAAEKQLEAHRRYYDVQFVVSGEELLQYAQLEGLDEAQPFDEGNDFGLYANPAREAWVTLHEGDIVVTPPEDAHKPGCCEDAPAPLKKICVKVLVD